MHADSLRHYVELDERGTEFLTPDARANEALRWARIALDQLKVCNPHLGCGYVAGIGPSGTGSRPNYAWFFQDALVTSPAYLEYGGADSVREIMQFSQKYQRADGKIAHEVSQSAGMMDWFKAYLWPYRHADAPMNYLTAMGDFYRFTGDAEFVKQSWPSIRKAYDYCLSILDPADGMFRIPENEWGGGETTMFSEDSGMTASWIVSLRAVRDLTLAVGDNALAADCERHEKQAAEALERLWNPKSQCYSPGLDRAGRIVPCHGPSLVGVAWRGILPPERVPGVLEPMNRISRLSDWGQIDTSFEDPNWVEGAYETGLAWPFQTSFPLLGLYRNHNTVQPFRTWMSMVNLRTFNARGALPEMMFGRYLRVLVSQRAASAVLGTVVHSGPGGRNPRAGTGRAPARTAVPSSPAADLAGTAAQSISIRKSKTRHQPAAITWGNVGVSRSLRRRAHGTRFLTGPSRWCIDRVCPAGRKTDPRPDGNAGQRCACAGIDTGGSQRAIRDPVPRRCRGRVHLAACDRGRREP